MVVLFENVNMMPSSLFEQVLFLKMHPSEDRIYIPSMLFFAVLGSKGFVEYKDVKSNKDNRPLANNEKGKGVVYLNRFFDVFLSILFTCAMAVLFVVSIQFSLVVLTVVVGVVTGVILLFIGLRHFDIIKKRANFFMFFYLFLNNLDTRMAAAFSFSGSGDELDTSTVLLFASLFIFL